MANGPAVVSLNPEARYVSKLRTYPRASKPVAKPTRESAKVHVAGRRAELTTALDQLRGIEEGAWPKALVKVKSLTRAFVEMTPASIG